MGLQVGYRYHEPPSTPEKLRCSLRLVSSVQASPCFVQGFMGFGGLGFRVSGSQGFRV